MSDYLDGALGDGDRDRLERHLAGCPHCTEYLAQLRATVDALGQVVPDDLSDEEVVPDDLSDEVLDEFVALYRRWSAG